MSSCKSRRDGKIIINKLVFPEQTSLEMDDFVRFSKSVENLVDCKRS